MGALWLALALAGCGGLTPGETEESDPVDDTGDPAPRGDEALVRSLIAGEGDPSVVVHEVAWSGGWPVRAGSSWLFVVADPRPGWALAGDHGAWEPAPMEQGDGFAWAEVEIPTPEGSGYKVVLDDAWTADPVARSYDYDEFGRISFVRPAPDRAHLERWPQLRGQGLAPRDVRVYVPAGAGPWPVLFMHDANNLFDPEGVWGGWRLQEALARVDPVLVVGLDNTADRVDEYTHTTDRIDGTQLGGEGDAYAALVHEDLRPWVEAEYPIAGPTGVMGSSLGGLISLYIAHRYPGEYDFAGSLSGTLGWGRLAESNPIMEELYLEEGHRDGVIYVDSGGGDGGSGCTDPDGDGFPEDDPDQSDNFCDNRHFADSLAAAGYTWDQDLFHWWEPDAPHNELAWAARVGTPLEIFAGLEGGR